MLLNYEIDFISSLLLEIAGQRDARRSPTISSYQSKVALEKLEFQESEQQP